MTGHKHRDRATGTTTIRALLSERRTYLRLAYFVLYLALGMALAANLGGTEEFFGAIVGLVVSACSGSVWWVMRRRAER